ncbi:hypothetical protein [uncultured Desulfobacter sp.]|uniref:hypothetical protein n=1 Tax=uncultured Desulfobacter sp. TaxID=240139 RepID=UPI0037496F87
MNRGGSWNNNPRNVRAANRNRNSADNRNSNMGFRLCFAPSPAKSAGQRIFLFPWKGNKEGGLRSGTK